MIDKEELKGVIFKITGKYLECKKLQEKIDKAIEYIKSYLPNYDFDHTNLEKLLEILGDKENE